MTRREDAGERRTRELKELAREGVAVLFDYPWKARVGTLHIWPYAGRWFDEITGQSGRINQLPMREFIKRF